MKLRTQILLFCGLMTNFLHAQTPMTFDWVKPISGASVTVSHIRLDADENIINAGFFQIWADLDPGPDTLRIQSIGNYFTAFIQKLDNEGNLLWAQPFYGTYTLGTRAFDLLPNGDMVVGIVFLDTLYVGNQHFVANTTDSDFVLAKVSSQGDLLWAKQIKGDKTQFVYDLKLDPSGDVYVTGYHTGLTDFDPDPVNTFLLSTPLNNSVGFVLKLNPDGELVQVKEFSSSEFTIGSKLNLRENDVYIGGAFAGTADFDPGPGQQLITSSDSYDCFVLNLDTAFNFKWMLPLAGTGVAVYQQLELDSDGNLLFGGVFNGTLDLDPGPAQTIVNSAGSDDSFLEKISPTGQWFWTKTISGPQQDFLYQIALDHQDNLYAFGTFYSSPDFDPGPAEYRVASKGNRDGFVLKLGPDGQFIDVRTVGGSSVDDIRAGVIGQNLNIYLAGKQTLGTDFDPGAPTYNLSENSGAFTEVLTQQYQYQGHVFRDMNGNGQKDAGEPPILGAIVSARNRQAFASTDDNGNYYLNYHLNHDTIAVNTPPYWSVTPPFYAVGNNQTNLDFAVNGPVVRDICITAAEQSIFRPGFENEIIIQVSNPGGIPVSFIPVKLKVITQTTPDPIELVSAVPAPAQTFSDEFRWVIPLLNDGEVFTIRAVLKTPASVPTGTPVILSISAPVDDDLDLSNNGLRIEEVTVGSFDPNDKQVTPAKVTPDGLDTTQLRYVVRFQNTGTFAADRVLIRDTLPKGIDISTLRVLGSSHPCTWRIYDGCLLEFLFNPIFLPDSTSNEPESKGFVIFGVKPQPWLKLGDKVRNRVGIYFDFNAPVITNDATLNVVQTVGAAESAAALPLDFQLYPNPATSKSALDIVFNENLANSASIRVFDADGRTVYTTQLQKGEQRIVLPSLSPGIYFLQVDAGGRTGVKQWIYAK